jgi:hypothetical protein
VAASREPVRENGVPASESGLASGLLNTTQQVGGSLGLAILSSVSTSRFTSALDSGSPLPVALTHGFKGAFVVAAVLCSIGLVVALVFLPPRRRRVADEHVERSHFRSRAAPAHRTVATSRASQQSAENWEARRRTDRRSCSPSGCQKHERGSSIP